jgi:hypothetical protein
MRPHPKRAAVNPRSPRAWATCDRSGFITNHEKLAWQFDWRGMQLVNLKILVAPDMLDKPQRQLGTIILPPDPPSIMNARPEAYSMEEQTNLLDQANMQLVGQDGIQLLASNVQSNAPQVVQDAHINSFGIMINSLSLTLPNPPTPGNRVIVAILTHNLSTPTALLTLNDGFNNYLTTPSGVQTMFEFITTSVPLQIGLFYLDVPALGAGQNLFASSTTTADNWEIYAIEVSGLIANAVPNDSFNQGVADVITAPSINAGTNSFVFTFTQLTGTLISIDNPWYQTPAAAAWCLNITGDVVAYLIAANGGTINANFTQAGNINFYHSYMAAFPGKVDL